MKYGKHLVLGACGGILCWVCGCISAGYTRDTYFPPKPVSINLTAEDAQEFARTGKLPEKVIAQIAESNKPLLKSHTSAHGMDNRALVSSAVIGQGGLIDKLTDPENPLGSLVQWGSSALGLGGLGTAFGMWRAKKGRDRLRAEHERQRSEEYSAGLQAGMIQPRQ